MTRSTETVQFRDAREDDLEAIVGLLADDVFGKGRNPGLEANRAAYTAAFREIDANPNDGYIVAVLDGRVVGLTQLSFLRGLSYTGGLRAQVESVRIAADMRGQRLGEKLLQEVFRRARDRQAVLVQLTTDVRRDRARAFYERLGFKASHVGMKYWL